jgi:integrase
MPKAGDQVKHHEAMPWRDVPNFYPGIEHPILKFLILTCMRSTEVREARWAEFDLTEKVWTVPKERMKMKREHRVPLTDQMIELLDKQKGLSPVYVFPSMKLRNAVPCWFPRRTEPVGRIISIEN